MKPSKLKKIVSGLEINDLKGTFDELIERLQKLKEWSQTLRNPDTNKPDPNGIKYIGVGFGGPSGHGTALYYEREVSDEEYEVLIYEFHIKRMKKDVARAEAELKRLKGLV